MEEKNACIDVASWQARVSSNSVALHGALPRVKHLGIIVLFDINASLVLDFSEFRSALLVHAILQVASHRAVTLAYLAKHVRLVSLLVEGLLESALFVRLVLTFDVSIDLPFVVLLEPIGLFLHSLLQQDVLFTVLVHVLEQVDTGLVLTTPLLLTSVPLLFVFNLSELVDHLLVRLLVRLRVLVMSLEFLDLSATSQAFFKLNLLDSTFTLQCSFKQNLVATAFSLLSLFSELLLEGVVLDQLEVTLAVEQELLVVILLLFLLFDGPLLAKHGLLLGNKTFLFIALELSRVLLPVKHGHRVFDLLLLFASLGHLSLELLLRVECPELSVDLLLHHLAFDVAALVNELLLAFDSSSVVVELRVFLSEGVVRGLELHVLAAGDFVSSFLLSLVLQSLQPLEHLLSDLLGRFQIVIEFLLIDAVLGGEQLGELGLSDLEVGGLASLHVLNAVPHDVLLDYLASLGLPVGLVGQVVVTADVIHLLGVFLTKRSKTTRRLSRWLADGHCCEKAVCQLGQFQLFESSQ